MTAVTLYGTAESISGFCCKGHAGYAEAGSDIVCAAISVLTQNCVNSLEMLAHITPIVSQSQETGMLEVLLPVPLTPQQKNDCQLLLSSMYLGLKDIESQYPRFLQLFIQDRRK